MKDREERKEGRFDTSGEVENRITPLYVPTGCNGEFYFSSIKKSWHLQKITIESLGRSQGWSRYFIAQPSDSTQQIITEKNKYQAFSNYITISVAANGITSKIMISEENNIITIRSHDYDEKWNQYSNTITTVEWIM